MVKDSGNKWQDYFRIWQQVVNPVLSLFHFAEQDRYVTKIRIRNLVNKRGKVSKDCVY